MNCVAALYLLKNSSSTATLARMYSTWISRLRGSPDRQRSRVVLLGLALCFWMVAFATHAHSGDDLTSNGPSTACSFCLSLPAGAPAPEHAAVSRLVPVVAETIVTNDVPLVGFDVPSFYLSQGPPVP
jgi:hypothetical protein